jgi:hypothetical protein
MKYQKTGTISIFCCSLGIALASTLSASPKVTQIGAMAMYAPRCIPTYGDWPNHTESPHQKVKPGLLFLINLAEHSVSPLDQTADELLKQLEMQKADGIR